MASAAPAFHDIATAVPVNGGVRPASAQKMGHQRLITAAGISLCLHLVMLALMPPPQKTAPTLRPATTLGVKIQSAPRQTPAPDARATAPSSKATPAQKPTVLASEPEPPKYSAARPEPAPPKRPTARPEIAPPAPPQTATMIESPIEAPTTEAHSEQAGDIPTSLAAQPAGPADDAHIAMDRLIDVHAAYRDNPRPAYPAMAKRLGWKGTVTLRVTVDPHGDPVDVIIAASSGRTILDQAAVNAVRQWRFRPATKAGRPIQDTVLVPVSFQLASGRIR